jgi:hypothetical protein
MVYHGTDLVFVVDGMDAITASYHFAGVTSHSPKEFGLDELWMMANGYSYQRRAEILQMTNVLWGGDKMDLEKFLKHGIVNETGKGGPVQLSPDLQQKIDAEIARIRQENPGLPKIKSVQ